MQVIKVLEMVPATYYGLETETVDVHQKYYVKY